MKWEETSGACSLQTDGTLWLGTKPDGLFRLRESGGINRIESPALTAATLQFRHYDMAGSGVPSDVAFAMTHYPGGTAVPMDARFFHGKVRFSNARRGNTAEQPVAATASLFFNKMIKRL